MAAVGRSKPYDNSVAGQGFSLAPGGTFAGGGAPACSPCTRCAAADFCAQVARTTKWVGSVSELAASPSINPRILRASRTPASTKFWCTELSGGT